MSNGFSGNKEKFAFWSLLKLRRLRWAAKNWNLFKFIFHLSKILTDRGVAIRSMVLKATNWPQSGCYLTHGQCNGYKISKIHGAMAPLLPPYRQLWGVERRIMMAFGVISLLEFRISAPRTRRLSQSPPKTVSYSTMNSGSLSKSLHLISERE